MVLYLLEVGIIGNCEHLPVNVGYPARIISKIVCLLKLEAFSLFTTLFSLNMFCVTLFLHNRFTIHSY